MLKSGRGSGASDEQLVAAADLLRALGNPVRLRLVHELARGESCVYELQSAVGVSQALVSQQLAKLRAAGIVKCRRDGSNVRYRIADERVIRVLGCIGGGHEAAKPRASRVMAKQLSGVTR